MKCSSVSLSAFAKVNLHLRVFPLRADGFHGIESIFQQISLADIIVVQYDAYSKTCVVNSPLMPLPKINTITKTWEAFSSIVKPCGGVRVQLLKYIPIGSGLGGGSSDAASFLLALNRIFDVHLTQNELVHIALHVGSDVPFFLSTPAAIVTGRGEHCTPLSARCDCLGILIFPEMASVTDNAYQLLDTYRINAISQNQQIFNCESLAAHYRLPVRQWSFYNDFEQVIRKQYDFVNTIFIDLYQLGAVFVRMSGSGSAVYGLFDTQSAFDTAYRTLLQKWQWCHPFLLLA